MKPRSEQSFLRLCLTSLAFYTLDMSMAIIGFVMGFGLTVESWWWIIGPMIIGRWITRTWRGAYELSHRKSDNEAAQHESNLDRKW